MDKQRMLFVDDRSLRLHAALARYSEKYVLTLCPNVPEALRLLREEWDVISLDFDLNGCDNQDPMDTTCGMEIVRYIARCGWPEDKPKPRVILHSSNVFGRTLMARELRRMDFFVIEERFRYDSH